MKNHYIVSLKENFNKFYYLYRYSAPLILDVKLFVSKLTVNNFNYNDIDFKESEEILIDERAFLGKVD